MRLTIVILSFLVSPLCFAQHELSGEVSLPEGAIAFRDFKNNVILDAFIDDSIPIKAMLDIGAWGLAVPERFRKNKDEISKYEKFRFSTGRWSKTMSATFMEPGSQFLQWYGEDCVLLGWDFFYRRIIEISYKDKYIKEWRPRDLAGLEGYECLEFKNKNRRLLIPAMVTVQGKEIAGNYWIDTGLNGTLFFTHNVLNDYELDKSKTKEGRAKNLDIHHTKVSLMKADIIRIGNIRLLDKDVIFSESEWFVFRKNDLYIGLLGNQFFKNFSVIFDFRENKLYLKSVED